MFKKTSKLFVGSLALLALGSATGAQAGCTEINDSRETKEMKEKVVGSGDKDKEKPQDTKDGK